MTIQDEPNYFEGSYKHFVQELGKFLFRLTKGVFTNASQLEGAKKYVALLYLNMEGTPAETASAAAFFKHALRHYSQLKAGFEAKGDYATAV